MDKIKTFVTAHTAEIIGVIVLALGVIAYKVFKR